MIKEVAGDILHTQAEAIAHGVAPNDHFDSGLALSLREAFPDMFKEFRHHCKQENPEPGETWLWKNKQGPKIFSLLTQEPSSGQGGHPGHATLRNVNHSLKELAKLVKKENIGSLAIPRLATGVGKLDWHDVKSLLDNHLGELGIPVYLYSTFVKGQKGDES